MSSAPIQLRIEDVAYGGSGVGRHEGYVLFVEGSLPGELVLARVESYHRNYGRARLIQILEPAACRMASDCPLCDPTAPPDSQCPGCCYRHVRYQEEVRMKQNQLTELLSRIGRVKNPTCAAPLPSPLADGYRNKIVLHGVKRGQSAVIGYVAADNQTILDVERCQLATPELNLLLQELRGRASEILASGEELRLVLRYAPSQGAIWWVDGRQEPPELVERTIIGEVAVPGGSFFQVNIAAADLLVRAVVEHVQKLQPRQVVDLYCGVGVFALAVAHAGVPAVWGIDHDRRAIQTALKNRERHSLPASQFQCARAAVGLRKLGPTLHPQETVIIVDPPRMGLDRETISAIKELRSANLLYVSCAADTLARDIALLTSAGYRFVQAQLVDMFPRTAYFETVALLAAA